MPVGAGASASGAGNPTYAQTTGACRSRMMASRAASKSFTSAVRPKIVPSAPPGRVRNLYELGCGHEFRELSSMTLLVGERGGGTGTTPGTSRLRNSASTASLYYRSPRRSRTSTSTRGRGSGRGPRRTSPVQPAASRRLRGLNSIRDAKQPQGRHGWPFGLGASKRGLQRRRVAGKHQRMKTRRAH